MGGFDPLIGSLYSHTHTSGEVVDLPNKFVNVTGDNLTGNLTADPGVTIDGVDISAHAADPSAHHAPVTLGTNTASALSLSGQQLSIGDVFVQNAGDTMTGQLLIQSSTDTQELIVKAKASQTANLQEWQNSTGTIGAGVLASGRIFSRGFSSGVLNTFIEGAGNSTATGSYNIAIGAYSCLPALTSGNHNIVFGVQAGLKMTSASYNIAIGLNSLSKNVIAGYNMAIGGEALKNTTSQRNTAIGYDTLSQQTSGTENLGLGTGAGKNNQTGSYNICIGNYSGTGVETNSYSYNTFIGANSGYSITTGSSNMFIGPYCGYNQTTASNIFLIDNQQRASAAIELTNSILYGVMAATPGSQTLRINAGTLIGSTTANALTIGVGTAGIDYILKFDGETNDGEVHWKEDEDYFEFQDDVTFNGDGVGLPYGNLYAYDAATSHAISGTGIANKVQVTCFATNGESNLTTPDHTTDDITIVKGGRYLITVSISALSGVGSGYLAGFGVFKNNGATQFTNLHAHRNLAGGGGDTGSINMSGIVDLAANDTIEVWTWNETNTTAIVIDDISLSLVMVGGT